MSAPVTAAPLARWKLWIFRFISLAVVPILFFVILNAALYCVQYGYSPRAIIPYRLENKRVYGHNLKFAWRFFPHTLARCFDGFVFDVSKAPGTYRIFVLGSSAAEGVPAPAYNFGHILDVMLDQSYPDIRFEVITVAMPAINSYAILEMARDCAEYQPDLFIVYMGNNEIVGPYGPGAVFSPVSPPLSVIRATIALKATRVGQLLEQVAEKLIPADKPRMQWGGMEMFLDKQVRYNDAAMEIAYRHFEQNLRDICRTGLDAGAAVIVSNVPVNLKDCPPFSSLHKIELTDTEKDRWQTMYQEGTAFEAQGQFDKAIEKYLDAEKIDAVFADLQFRLGLCYWNTGDYQKAKEKYILAREYDTLRFRADNRINDIIRAVADTGKTKNLYFADSIGAFEAESPHQIPGSELFYEHVHMNFKGTCVLAQSLLPGIRKILPLAPQSSESAALGEQEIAHMIGYTDYERVVYLNLVYLTLLQRPPFTKQLYHEQYLAAVKRQIDDQLLSLDKRGLGGCLEQHRQALLRRPDDWLMRFQYAAFLNSGMHDTKAEETELRKVISQCPYYQAYLNLGRNLNSQNRSREAQIILTKYLKYVPYDVEFHSELAVTYAQCGEYQSEIQHLLTVLSVDPEGKIGIYAALADAYNKTGNPEQAIEVLHKAIQLFPEEKTASIHAFLAYLLYYRNDFENARKEIQFAIKINPGIKNDPSWESLLKTMGIKP